MFTVNTSHLDKFKIKETPYFIDFPNLPCSCRLVVPFSREEMEEGRKAAVPGGKAAGLTVIASILLHYTVVYIFVKCCTLLYIGKSALQVTSHSGGRGMRRPTLQ